MEHDTLKLVVIAIIALLLLSLFLFYFAPLYIWKEKPGEAIKKQLKIAETDLGHYHNQKSQFPKEFTVKAEGYENQNRSLIFECNSEIFCCPKGKKCPRAIEWDNNANKRYFSFKETKPVQVSARCRHEKLYICRVYIGKQPAQVKITSAKLSDTSLDLTKKKTTTITYRIKNTGKKDMIAVQTRAKLYKIKKKPFGQEPEKTLVKEINSKQYPLRIGEETEKQLKIPITENGDYEIEFTTFETTDETNYETKKFEIKARGLVRIGKCTPGPVKKEWFSEKECRYFFPCEDCMSVIECEKKWREKYNLPIDFKFELWKNDEVNGTIWLKVPGKYKKECKRNCYPEFKVVDELKKARKPIDLVFVIDASGSMSDDIEEVKGVIERLYKEVGENCKIEGGEEKEPCLQIGVYLFEGAFKECYDNPNNPFFHRCLTEERSKHLFTYDSYYYVECNQLEYNLFYTYHKYCNATQRQSNPAINAMCTKIESYLQGREKTGVRFDPPSCRAKKTAFIFPTGSILSGQKSDVGLIPLTTNLPKITNALDEVIATQGTEAWADALYFVLSSSEMHWRPNSDKTILLITDTANNPATMVEGGSLKTLPEVVELAKKKNTRIFSLAANGCDSMNSSITYAMENYLTNFFGTPQRLSSLGPELCPDSDMQYVSSNTGAKVVRYGTASGLPKQILNIVKDQVAKTTNEHGLKNCKPGETPETCNEYCVLPWEEKCQDCTCFKYNDEHLKDNSMLDVLFVLDASGSMEEELGVMRQRIGSIIDSAESECKRIGVKNCMRASVRLVFGHPDSPRVLNLTPDMEKVKEHVESAFAGGGGDEKDPWAGEALISLWSDNWSPHSKKLVFILTDAANNPKEIASEDYTASIKAAPLSAELDSAVVELGNFAKNNGFKVFGVYSKNSTASPKQQLEWLAKQTGGRAVGYLKGDDFSHAISAVLKGEIRTESEKPWCSDAECKNCGKKAVDTESVPVQWNYNFMCSYNSKDCNVLLSCYTTPYDISLSECQRKWQERAEPGIKIKQDTEKNLLYVEGKRLKDGVETNKEDWTECELPKVSEKCGGKTVEREQGIPGGQSSDYISPWQKVESESSGTTGNGNESNEPHQGTCVNDQDCTGTDCSSASCSNPEPKCQQGKCACECPQQQQAEKTSDKVLDCMRKLDCYCETGNDSLEYIDRIKEAGKPVDLLVVLDATESMHDEGAEFYTAFSNLEKAMQKECKVNGEPCLKVGILAFGGGASNQSAALAFDPIKGSGFSELEKGLGIAMLSSDPSMVEKIRKGIDGIEYKYETEPWADALYYAFESSSKGGIGWRDNAQKAVLLITSEANNGSVKSISDAKNAVLTQGASFYAAVRNLQVGGENPASEARQIGGKVFEYETKVDAQGNPTGLWFENGKPFKDVFSIVLKDLVQDMILHRARKIQCTEQECNSCKNPGNS